MPKSMKTVSADPTEIRYNKAESITEQQSLVNNRESPQHAGPRRPRWHAIQYFPIESNQPAEIRVSRQEHQHQKFNR